MLPEYYRRIRRSAYLRRAGTPILIAQRRMTASGIGSPLLINSIPKSGTHLVTSMLNQLPHISFSGRVIVHDSYSKAPDPLQGVEPSYNHARLQRDLARIAPGTYANAHLYFDEPTRATVSDLGFAGVFVFRDPRDVCVSQVRYIESFRGHPNHSRLMNEYPDFNSRLMAIISGFPPSAEGRGMADVGRRLQSFIGWKSQLSSFAYEEFIGQSSDVDLVVRRLAGALGIPQSDEHIELMRRGIGNRWSPTMRDGGTQGWRTSFAAHHIEAMQTVASQQMAQLGYLEW